MFLGADGNEDVERVENVTLHAGSARDVSAGDSHLVSDREWNAVRP